MEVVVYVTEYKRTLKARGYAKATIESYSSNINLFREYLHGRGIEDLREVTKKVIHDYHANIMKIPRAMETKALRIRSVKRFFEYLEEINKLLINPTEGIRETTRKNRPIGTVMTQHEVRQILDQPNLSLRPGIRDRAIMEVLYSTGIRLGELIHITVYDVDLTEGLIYIRKGKGRKQRVVPLGKSAVFYVKEYLHKIRPRYAAKNRKVRELFLSNYGTSARHSTVQQMILRYRIEAGIKTSVSPHTFRRSCATHMLQNGADIRHVQKLLGHKNLSSTQLYTKVIPVDLKKIHTQTHPASLRYAVASPETQED